MFDLYQKNGKLYPSIDAGFKVPDNACFAFTRQGSLVRSQYRPPKDSIQIKDLGESLGPFLFLVRKTYSDWRFNPASYSHPNPATRNWQRRRDGAHYAMNRLFKTQSI